MNMKIRDVGVGSTLLLLGSTMLAGCAVAQQDPAPAPTVAETKATQSSALSVDDVDDEGGADDAENKTERRFRRMLRSPIRPPAHVAGLNLDHGQFGLTFEEITARAGTPVEVDPPNDFDGRFTAFWGANHELEVTFNPAKGNAVTAFAMGPGYTGKAHFRSRCGGAYGDHEYTIGIGTVERDGQPFRIPFSDAAEIDPLVTEIYDAAIATFQPSEPPVTSCHAARTCLIVPDDGLDERIIGLRGGIDFYWVTPVGSTTGPNLVYTVWRPAD